VTAYPGCRGKDTVKWKWMPVCCILFVMIVIILIIAILICVCLQLSSVQQIMISQLSDGMMHPVNKFLQADVDGLSVMISCSLCKYICVIYGHAALRECLAPILLSRW